MQYGCNEAEREQVLARCQRSDGILQLLLGATPLRTAQFWGPALLLIALIALAASLAGLPPP